MHKISGMRAWESGLYELHLGLLLARVLGPGFSSGMSLKTELGGWQRETYDGCTLVRDSSGQIVNPKSVWDSSSQELQCSHN